ncbi:MAG: hypothetical protein ACKVP0_01895 [Pirellulaceae bacterium]
MPDKEKDKTPKPAETPFDRFESLMKRLVAVPKEELDKAKGRTPSGKNKKRPKSR